MTTRRIEHRLPWVALRWSGRGRLRSRTALAARVVVALAVAGGCGLAAPDGPGTRANPTPVGQATPVGPYSVSVGQTTVDALDVLLAADPANTPPARGRQFVMVPVTVSLDEAASGVPWEDIAFRFVTADGDAFGAAQQDQCGVVPAALGDVGAVPGATPVPGNVCVSVPTEGVDDGTWLIKEEGALTGWSGYHQVLAAAPSGGTRAAPTPVDVPAQIGSYAVSVGTSVLDIDGTITAADPPAPGRRHVLVPMTVTNAGSESGNPWEDIAIRLVRPRGSAVGSGPEDQCGGVPDALAGVGDIAPGATVTGTVCVSAPTDNLDGWTWLVQEEGSLTGLPAFFSVR